MDFLKMALDIKEELIDIRRDFHQYPELGFEEYETSKKIKDFLDKEGIEYKECAKTGVCAIIHGKGNKTVAIRADMDALPIKEKGNKCYISKNEGKMHACGHDAHTTILLGVAKTLNKIKDSLNGNIKLFFEPAEETVGGAPYMIKEGVLENPNVDAVIGLHVEEWLTSGTIGIKEGVVNAASNPFKIKINGKGGHGARPEMTIDPIIISCNVINALQTFVSREVSPTEPAVLTIGSIHGGTAQNIIPESVEISGILRTMTKENRDYSKKRLVEITQGIVKSMRGTCEINIEESYPCLYNDNNMCKLLEESVKDMLGNESLKILDVPTMGVESFAYFSMERPAVFYYLGCGNHEKGINNSAHSSLFDIDEDCLPIGVAVQCKAAFEYLRKNK